MEETIGQRIRRLREEQRLGQRELARRAEINQGGLSMIETGDREPTTRVLKNIARALGVAPAVLDPELAGPKSGLSTDAAPAGALQEAVA